MTPYRITRIVGFTSLVLGVLILLYYRAQGREDWVRNAGAAFGEGEAELERTVGYP